MTGSTRAAANAANAKLSTGPWTEAGKARSSRNAVKHELTSRQLVIAPGEEQAFAELQDSLHDQLAPEGALEMGIFNMLVHAAWNIERFRTLEAQLMANGVDALLDESTAKALDPPAALRLRQPAHLLPRPRGTPHHPGQPDPPPHPRRPRRSAP